MRRRSLHVRLRRLAERRSAADMELAIHALAVEYGEDPADVRAEVENNVEQIRRFAHLTTDEFVRRRAADLGVPEDELRAEVTRAENAVYAAVGIHRQTPAVVRMTTLEG